MPATLDLEDLRVTVADTLDLDVEEITDDAHFIKDLGVDSLMALEVMVTLEKKYKIKLDESQLKKVTCLNNVYALLAERLGTAA